MRVAVCALALAGLTGLGACASHKDMADTGYTAPVAAAEPAPPPAYTPPPAPEPAPPPPPVETTTRAGERG